MNSSNVPELISKAKRKNLAYQTYYGPEAKLTNAITRDLAADRVITRRSWFPTIATAEYFSSPPLLTKHDNIMMTRGRDLTNVDTFRERAKPGTMPYHNQWGNLSTAVVVDTDDTKSGHIFGYLILIILAVIFISMLF